MKTGPLNESELEWLDDILTKYNTDHAILDVAELDGLLTAVLSSPQEIEPEQWLVAGGVGLTMCRAGRQKRDDALYESGFSTYGRYRRASERIPGAV